LCECWSSMHKLLLLNLINACVHWPDGLFFFNRLFKQVQSCNYRVKQARLLFGHDMF
jgi:hypothetical protein